MPNRAPLWSKVGWVSTGPSHYVHPEYGVVEEAAGFWTAESHPKLLPRVVANQNNGLTFFASCRTMHEAMQEAKRFTERAAGAQKDQYG